MALRSFREDRRRENFDALVASKKASVAAEKAVVENKTAEKSVAKATKTEKTDVSKLL
jgi:hypothetical protein